jgi:hypothetical protein
VSLIFEALKKLERERDTTERGFQVIAQTPWPARSRAARLALLSIVAGALAGAGAWGAWTWLSSRRGEPVPAPAASTAAAQPTARPLAPPIWESPAPGPSAPPARAAGATAAGATSAGATSAATPQPPPASAPPASPVAAELRLEAISAQDGEPVAVINGQLVRKGDSVEGALVLSIGTDSVELEIEGRRRVLTF